MPVDVLTAMLAEPMIECTPTSVRVIVPVDALTPIAPSVEIL